MMENKYHIMHKVVFCDKKTSHAIVANSFLLAYDRQLEDT
jgi:hypothetical protein